MTSPRLPKNRTANMSVLDKASGKLLWSHLIEPKLWPVEAIHEGYEPDELTHTNTAMKVVAVGSDDDIVLLNTGGIGGHSCSQVLLRVTPNGKIKWEQHWNLPFGAHPGAYPLGTIIRQTNLSGSGDDANGLAPLASGDFAVMISSATETLIHARSASTGVPTWSVGDSTHRGNSFMPIPGTDSVQPRSKSAVISSSGIADKLGDGEDIGDISAATPGPPQPFDIFAGHAHSALCVTASGYRVCAEAWSSYFGTIYTGPPDDVSPLAGRYQAATWNAETNTVIETGLPLMSGGTIGYGEDNYLVVMVQGTSNLDGIDKWSVGDVLYFLDGYWHRYVGAWSSDSRLLSHSHHQGITIREPSVNGWSYGASQYPGDDDGLVAKHMPAETDTIPPGPFPSRHHYITAWNTKGTDLYDPSDLPFIAKHAATIGDLLYVNIDATAGSNRRIRCYDISSGMAKLWDRACAGVFEMHAVADGVIVIGSDTIAGETVSIYKLDIDGNTLWGHVVPAYSACVTDNYIVAVGTSSYVP